MAAEKVFLSLKKQDKPNCAIACLSMLTNRPLREIESLTRRDEGVSKDGIEQACHMFGVPLKGTWTSNPWQTGWGSTRPFPPDCLLIVKENTSPDDGRHAMVCFDNMIYDPNGHRYHCSDLDIRWTMLKYLEIETETLTINAKFHLNNGDRRTIGVYRSYIPIGATN